MMCDDIQGEQTDLDIQQHELCGDNPWPERLTNKLGFFCLFFFLNIFWCLTETRRERFKVQVDGTGHKEVERGKYCGVGGMDG